MHWIIQNNIFKESAWDEFVATLNRFGIPYSEHKVVPFVGELHPDPEISGNVICMGSYSMRHIAKKKGWYPGVFDLQEFNFMQQREKWGEHMLNCTSVVVPFKDARWQPGEERFLRPIDDSKYFSGGLYEYDEFAEWQKNVCILKLDYGNSLTPETLIQVEKPRKIYTEYRCWVVKGRIVTMSLYKRGSQVVYENWDGRDDGIQAYAQDRVNEWQPAEAFVIDVCETPDGFKIVEINTINSCGFYAANIPVLVDALQEGFSK